MKELYGGPGSGNFGHSGRPGEVGGSDSPEHPEVVAALRDLKEELANEEFPLERTKLKNQIKEYEGVKGFDRNGNFLRVGTRLKIIGGGPHAHGTFVKYVNGKNFVKFTNSNEIVSVDEGETEKMELKECYGGPGSGNFGHAGIPGQVGGSASRENSPIGQRMGSWLSWQEKAVGNKRKLDASKKIIDELNSKLDGKISASKRQSILDQIEKELIKVKKLKLSEYSSGLKECYGVNKEKTPEAFLFAEIKDTKRIFVAREAPLKHRRGITRQDILDIKKNFEDQAIGRDVDIDYEHKNGSRGGQAAGWLKSLEMVEENGKLTLYGVPEYTPDAEKATSEKVYKYTSPEIHFGWQHPENGKKYSAVLKSLALLNNPQLIGQPAVQAMYSEIYKKLEV